MKNKEGGFLQLIILIIILLIIMRFFSVNFSDIITWLKELIASAF